MLFSSITFLYYFLPCVLFLYFLAPKRIKNAILLITSLVFYAWGEPKYVFLMLISILLGFLGGMFIERFKGKNAAKIIFCGCLGIQLVLLGYFKYATMFVPSLKVLLPIGISFYTFQMMGYLADVYRGEVNAQRNVINFGAYVSMFPQLIAGPIVRYKDVNRELESRNHTADKIAEGIRRFVIGLAKKILLANQFGEICSIIKASNEQTVLFYWMYAIAFALQIYFDFSGYSDMAIGLGKIFGFTFLENFDYPYIATSITDFWRRWHKSLGTWFRDYVYIPLGGNRVSKPKWIRNILIVWALTGLWHGASWNFVIWGLYFGLLLLLEKFVLLKYLEKAKGIRHIYVLFLVIIGFTIFDAVNLGSIFTSLSGMFGLSGAGLVSAKTLYYFKSYFVILLLGIIGATPLPKWIISKIMSKINNEYVKRMLELIVYVILVIVATAFLVDGSFNPFLYFRF